MKKFALELGKSVGVTTLKTVRVASVGTLGLASAILGTTSNVIVSGCTTGINKLKGKKTSFNSELCYIHDLNHLANKIMDGRISIVEAYDSVVPDQWKMVIEYLSSPYKAAAMDISQDKAAAMDISEGLA